MTCTRKIKVVDAAILATFMSVSAAFADCQWTISGTLEGERPNFPGNPPIIWALSGIEVRVNARWANMACPQVGFNSIECPWNGAAWSSATTDSQGRFTIQSAAFPDPVCQKDRDFRIEVRGFPVTNWTVAGQVDGIAGPNGLQGPQIPMASHRARLGTIRTDVFPAPTEVEWSRPEEEEEERTPRMRPRTELPTTRGGSTPQAAEVPCGMEMRGMGASTEFRFGAMNASSSNISSDRALRVETRTDTSGRMAFNLLTVHILVENAGQRGFTYSNRCPAKVRVRINEGPGERANNGWGEFQSNMPSVPGNTEVPYQDDLNLLGVGNDYVDEPWDRDWEYVLFQAELDPNNDVVETAEGDNVIQHCYHAPTNSFTNMSNCSTR